MRIKLSGVRSVAITGEFIKLDSLLKLAYIAATGGEAKQLIQSGVALVNGEPCLMRGKKLVPGDVVRCGGDTLIVKRRGDQ